MEEKQEIITPTTMEMTAGEMLRNARTTGRRKREITTIAKLLCIREDYLTALEEGNYNVIPEVVYILGFARSYAVELGLDPDVVILKIKRELGLIREDKRDEVIEHKTEPVKQPVVKSEPQTKTEPKVKKEIVSLAEKIKPTIQFVKKNWMWFVGGLVTLIAVVAVAFVLFGESGDKSNENIAPETNDAIVMPGDEQNALSENAEKTENTNVENEKVLPAFRYPINEQFDVKNSEKGHVVLQVEKEQWIKIEDGRGNTVFTRVLVPGDVYYLPAGDNYKATFGNAGAVDVWVDGQLVNKVGPMNTRKSGISLSPNALKALGFAG